MVNVGGVLRLNQLSGGVTMIVSRVVGLAAAVFLMATTAEAHRVALLIGQNAYVKLKPLGNPARDAGALSELLTKHGFDLIGCDGKPAGCVDLDRKKLLAAMK